LNCRSDSRLDRSAHALSRAESRCRSHSCRFRQHRVQQRRVPHPPAQIAGEQWFSLPKQARFFCV